MERPILAILIAAALLPGAAVFAQPALPDLVGPAEWDALSSGEKIARAIEPGGAPGLLPRVAAAEAVLRELEGLELTVGAETLLLIDTPRADLRSPQGMLWLYNRLRAVSGMEGLEYWSASRKRMRTLFTDSYAVDSPEGGRRLPDPLVGQVPAESRIFVYQKDLSFGENVHRVDYRFDGGSVQMTMRNLETIRYLGIPLIRPLESVSVLLAIPEGDRVLLYALSGTRTARFLGLERSKKDSLFNRLVAIAGWCEEALSREAP